MNFTTDISTVLESTLFFMERADPLVLSDEEAGAILDRTPWRRPAVIGDSVAEGIGDPVAGYRYRSWADRLVMGLETAAGPIDYLNLGQRGLDAARIRDTQLDAALEFGVDLAVVCAG